ncbi:LysR substrate-binding domain-containing protein [Shewanella sp. GXUN23E]|uniref:LysR substrate-binding domain-containing protein n=1 Tax=Shewanella sp. GXUN23E TaxID=3422498 RepID=UPI003D7D4982
MMRWEGVTEFVSVVDTGSFTSAGKVLGISTAQVSRQVNQLENRLNTKLLYRTTRKISLTEEGRIFYQHCRQALDGLEEAERAMSNLHISPQGSLKMTAPVIFGEQYVMPAVLDYMQLYPEVEVTCELTNQPLDLVQGGYDLAVRLGHLKDSSMMARLLGNRTLHVCASPSYLTRFGAPHTLSELNQHNCLIGTNSHWRFMEEGRLRSIKVKGTLNCGSGHVLVDAAIRGIGVIQMPGYYVEDAIADGRLIPLLQTYQEPKEGIWALYPHNRHQSPKVRLLVDMLAQKLSAMSR